MEETSLPVVPAQNLTFTCATIAIAQRGNSLDQISLFPLFPAPKEVFAELLSKDEKFPSPQFLIYTSTDRGHLYSMDNFGVKVQGARAAGINKELSWGIHSVTVLVKEKFPDQVILYTDLPYPTKNPGGKFAPVAFLTNEGFGERYCKEILKLDCEVRYVDPAARRGLA